MTSYELDTPVGKVEVEVLSYTTYRQAKLNRGRIEVTQFPHIDGTGLCEPPTVTWSNGMLSHHTAREFAQTLLVACDIAEKWNEDTGKPFSSLKLPEVQNG